MSTITLGVDLAKRVFSVCEMDAAGHVLRRQELKRDAFAAWLAQQPAGTIVAMEACSGAHHWAQRRLEYRLQPSLRRRRSERFRSREAFDPQRPLLSNAIRAAAAAPGRFAPSRTVSVDDRKVLQSGQTTRGRRNKLVSD
jgi:transposase